MINLAYHKRKKLMANIKYCPILCNPDGLGGSNRCNKHSDC